MKWGTILGVTFLIAGVTLYEWPKLKLDEKKEKGTLIALATVGWLLAILLAFMPDMPGPTQLVEFIFKPLSALIEQITEKYKPK